MFEQEKYPSIFATQIGTHYQVSMQQVFGNPYLYDETIYLLQTASPNDVISFTINSDGGDLMSLVALQNAIHMSEARIVMILLGACASAGGAFFLTEADEYIVGSFTHMMVHNMICGVGFDDTQKIATRARFNESLNIRFVQESYEGFLTDQEIYDVTHNSKELYLDEFEIRERLMKRDQKRMEQAQEEAVQQMKEFEEASFDYSELSLEQLEEELKFYTEDMKEIRKAIASKKKEVEADASSKPSLKPVAKVKPAVKKQGRES